MPHWRQEIPHHPVAEPPKITGSGFVRYRGAPAGVDPIVYLLSPDHTPGDPILGVAQSDGVIYWEDGHRWHAVRERRNWWYPLPFRDQCIGEDLLFHSQVPYTGPAEPAEARPFSFEESCAILDRHFANRSPECRREDELTAERERVLYEKV